MSHGTCETVKIVTNNDDGYKLINKSDLTEDDKIYEASTKKETRKKADKKAD